MKILIAIIIAAPIFASADVKIHTNNFSVAESSTGEHFWTRLYDWNAWSKTPEQSKMKITPNPVKTAYDKGLERVDVEELTYDDFVDVFGEFEAEPLEFFHIDLRAKYDYEDDEDENDVTIDKIKSWPYKGLVTHMKVSLPVAKGKNLLKLSLNEMAALIIKADTPHLHKKVSKDFVTKFIDPIHNGHADVKSGGEFYISMVNMKNKYYNCDTMNNNLAGKAEIDGISVYDDNAYRMYMINRIKELDQDSVKSLGAAVGPGAVRVFEQKIVYSSNLLQSGVNYYAVYETANGPRLVMTSVLVATSKLQSYMDLYLNGFSVTAAYKHKREIIDIALKDGVAVVGADNVDVSPAIGSCRHGLGQGIAEYVYNLAKRIAN